MFSVYYSLQKSDILFGIFPVVSWLHTSFSSGQKTQTEGVKAWDNQQRVTNMPAGMFTSFPPLVCCLQMLRSSRVTWRGTRGRGTRPTSAARWRLTPEPQWFGTEMASRCPPPTSPTWRSTPHRPSATWRSVAPYWHTQRGAVNRRQRECLKQLWQARHHY